MRRVTSTIPTEKWEEFCRIIGQRVDSTSTDEPLDTRLSQKRRMRIYRRDNSDFIFRIRANKRVHEKEGLRYTYLILTQNYRIYAYEPYILETVDGGLGGGYSGNFLKTLQIKASIKSNIPVEELEELLMVTLLQNA